jgi:hypothetical protein
VTQIISVFVPCAAFNFYFCLPLFLDVYSNIILSYWRYKLASYIFSNINIWVVSYGLTGQSHEIFQYSNSLVEKRLLDFHFFTCKINQDLANLCPLQCHDKKNSAAFCMVRLFFYPMMLTLVKKLLGDVND